MAPSEGERETPRPPKREAPPETAKKRPRLNGDDKCDAPTQAAETEDEAKARQERDEAKASYVTKWIEFARQNDRTDNENWTITRLESIYADAFDANEDGILGGHSQRDWL